MRFGWFGMQGLSAGCWGWSGSWVEKTFILSACRSVALKNWIFLCYQWVFLAFWSWFQQTAKCWRLWRVKVMVGVWVKRCLVLLYSIISICYITIRCLIRTAGQESPFSRMGFCRKGLWGGLCIQFSFVADHYFCEHNFGASHVVVVPNIKWGLVEYW